MSYYFLCPKPVPLILQILNIYKQLDLSESILCVSQIRYSQKFTQYSPNKSVFSSLPIVHKETLLWQQIQRYITIAKKKYKNDKPPLISWSVYSEFMARFTPVTSLLDLLCLLNVFRTTRRVTTSDSGSDGDTMLVTLTEPKNSRLSTWSYSIVLPCLQACGTIFDFEWLVGSVLQLYELYAAVLFSGKSDTVRMWMKEKTHN